jgi:DNA-binding NarL/FixJ family response regulator
MMRLLLYTDEPVLAQGLTSILVGTQSFEVMGACSSMTEIKQAVQKGEPDLLLLDLTPEVTFSALSEIKRSILHCKVVLWVHTIATELAFQAMGLGVRGILRKTLGPELVVKCLTKVHQGELWFEKALTDSFLSAKRISLTKREGQLVALLSQGLKNKEIASTLLISEGTVKVYLSKLFQKVGVKDRFELALYGLKNLSAGPPQLERGQGETAVPVPVTGLRSLVMDRQAGPHFSPATVPLPPLPGFLQN